MFNEIVKNCFLDSLSEGTSCTIRSMFAHSEPAERKYNVDIGAMDKDQLEDVFSNYLGTRSNTVEARFSHIRMYVNWLADNDFDHSRAIRDMSVRDIKLNGNYYRSPIDLNNTLDVVFADSPCDTIECVYRTYFWIAFAGVPFDQSVKISTDNVDFESLQFVVSDYTFPIYRDGIEAIRNATNLQQLRYINANYLQGSTYRDRVDGNQILRGVRGKNTELTPRKISKSCLGRFHKVGVTIIYEDVYMSGVFYRAYEEEIRTGSCNFFGVVKMERELKYSGNNELRNDISAIRKDSSLYMSDYQRWKDTFIYKTK